MQGGIGTVKSVNRAIKDKCPIVLIADSGGAATVITQFVETYQDERSEYYGYGEIPQTYRKRYEPIRAYLNEIAQANQTYSLHANYLLIAY